MNSKQLNLSIIAGVVIFVVIVMVDRASGPESSAETKESEVVETVEVVEDTGRILDGQVPLNWESVSLKEARETSRAERLEKSMSERSEAQSLTPAEFQKMKDEQFQALLKKAEQPYEDDDGEELTAERVRAIHERGDMVW